MPLVGGGGAPNVAGSNPAGIGTSINYIGNHAYAYSGVIASSGTATAYLQFTTGNGYIVAEIQPVYVGQGTNNIQYIVKLDGQIINSTEVTSSRDYTPFDTMKIIIPAYTKVEVLVDNVSGGTEDAAVVLTGEVYY